MAVLAGGLFIYNAWPTIPYFFATPPSANANASETRQYRVLSFNVLRTNVQLELTLDQIFSQDADFVFLMEVQNDWKTYFEGIRERYPYQKILTDPAYTGVAFLSKHPWKTLDVITLGAVSNPSIDVQIPRLDSALRSFRIIATHPLPPLGKILTDSRDQQLKVLAERFRLNEPNMMIGDLNLSPWSPRFAALLKIADLKDASIGRGIATTLAPLPTLFGGIKVDHVLTGGPIIVQQFRTQSSAYSDHKIVIVDFVVEYPLVPKRSISCFVSYFETASALYISNYTNGVKNVDEPVRFFKEISARDRFDEDKTCPRGLQCKFSSGVKQ